MRITCWLATAALVVLSACKSSPQRQVAIGEGYVAPASLKLRDQLGLRAQVTATVNHGERLEILERRRRFVKVLTAGGATGWMDGRMLLTTGQMARLRRLAEEGALRPSQGNAVPFGPLNMHTEPNRQAPSFRQIEEKEAVDVLDREVTPRVPYEAPALEMYAPLAEHSRTKPARGKEQKEFPDPPMPSPPRPPGNWLELSRRAEPPVPPGGLPRKLEPAKQQPRDVWFLVRTRSGQVGWAMANLLRMDLPDEVAQHAQGARITSYFALGQVTDQGVDHPNWLWTTTDTNLEPHDFDSFRVFVWGTRRHRYETVYIERRLQGFLPVEVQAPEDAPGRRHFTLTFRGRDGVLLRRTYAFQNNRVRLADKRPPPATVRAEIPAAPSPPHPEPVDTTTLVQRIQHRLQAIWRRFLGDR